MTELPPATVMTGVSSTAAWAAGPPGASAAAAVKARAPAAARASILVRDL
jgi:hypothetical protein